ncbi:hypothetical protein [Streptomyces sp. NBC_00572]|uniref:AMIN-like domain-containing (lipo)protein n=1 Tax=Streptomyces sp. NBC_00572 TaxID=2903664 RepID=UPI0022548962|nr:hypothetical protein [Streptomyces sp. NBC_00572]MCX4981485.1 AMIN domain-containing protein [Streptomyces sp. NBC_00572]
MPINRSVMGRLVAPTAAALLATLVAAPTASAAPARATASVCDPICVTGVRAATHTGYDRVVFDLGTGPLPTVTATQSTSGDFMTPFGEPRTIKTPGSSYLFVAFSPANIGDPLHSGPAVTPFGLPTVKAVQSLYEEQLDSPIDSPVASHLGITLDGPVSRYNVFTLTQPNRVVIDIYR